MASDRGRDHQPLPNVQVAGAVPILGIAGGSQFHSYGLQFAPGIEAGARRLGGGGAAPVPTGAGALAACLGPGTRRALAPGPYSLRLLVYDTNGQSVFAEVSVEVVAP